MSAKAGCQLVLPASAGHRGTRGSALTPCLLLPAPGWAGLSQVRLIQQHSQLPATLGLRLTRVTGEQVELGHTESPKPAVTAGHQLLCHSPGPCHWEVTVLGAPDRWPYAGAGGSAASVVLLRTLTGDKCACMCQQ